MVQTPKIKIANLPVPKSRVACFFCGKPLMKGRKFDDLILCTSRGVIFLTCKEHAEAGDQMVRGANSFLAHKQQPQPSVESNN